MSDWKKVVLGDLGKTFNGLSGKSKDDFGAGGSRYIPYLNIFNNSIIDPAELEIVRVKPGEKQNPVKYGDLFFTTSSETIEEVGMTSVLLDNLDNVYLNSFCFGFRQHNFDTLLPEFVPFLFRSTKVRKDITYFGQGSTRYNLGKTNLLEKLELSIPPLPVQQKIAHILSTVDRQIEKTKQLILKYEMVKEGMMQDLFNRGIDVKTGKLRPSYDEAPGLYKESELGWIPKEWTVRKLSDVTTNLDGKRIPLKQEDRDLMEPRYPYYGASGVIDFVEDYIFDDHLILIGEDGENVLSRNLPLAFSVKGKIWVNNHAHVIKPMPEHSINYLTEYLESLDYSSIVSGSAQPKITQGHLSKTLIRLPIRLEQDLIFQRIEAMVKIIDSNVDTLNQNVVLKTGLMQDLLTGKVNLT